MSLVLNEEQVMLRDSAAGFLAEKAGVAQLRALRDSADARGYEPAVWQQMVEMGWAGIAIAEEHGGLGYGYLGLGLILEQAGRALSASPLESTVLVASSVINELASTEQKATLLPAVASGELLLSLALQEGPHHAPQNTKCHAEEVDGSFRLNGDKCLVLDAVSANKLIVIARTGGEVGDTQGLTALLVAADAAGVSIEPRSMVDSRSAAAVSFNNVQIPKADCLGEPGAAWTGLERALDIANIGQSSLLLGLSVEAFERTVAYLQERQQFGRIIGSFQGLQHRAAEMFAELELARSLVLKALQQVDAGEADLSLIASAAKAKLCQVAQQVSNEAVQMHGGIGMTDEHDIGLFLKRARAVQHYLGDYNYHLDRFALGKGY